MNEKKTKENNKTLIISLIVGVVALIGIVAVGTYSFYTASVSGKGNESGNDPFLKTGTLEATLTDGNLTGSDLLPGEAITKTFSVKNTGTGSIKFKLVWKSVTNTFVNQNDLIVTLKENETMKISESDNQTVPATTTQEHVIKDNLTIAPNETKTYVLTILYKNTNSDQSADIGKSIGAKIGLAS